MGIKRVFLWCGVVFAAALCLLVSVGGAVTIYHESQVLAFGKLRHQYISLAENFTATFILFVVLFILLLRERRSGQLK